MHRKLHRNLCPCMYAHTYTWKKCLYLLFVTHFISVIFFCILCWSLKKTIFPVSHNIDLWNTRRLSSYPQFAELKVREVQVQNRSLETQLVRVRLTLDQVLWCLRFTTKPGASLWGGEPSLLGDGELSGPSHPLYGSGDLSPGCTWESPELPSQGTSFHRSFVGMRRGTLYSFKVTRVISIFIQGENPHRRELRQALTSSCLGPGLRLQLC